MDPTAYATFLECIPWWQTITFVDAWPLIGDGSSVSAAWMERHDYPMC